jgi:type IV pilus assembly protein PilA
MAFFSPLKESRGFSLVEVLVVIAIIGILVSIAVPNYLSYRTRGQFTRTASDLRTIARGFRLYSVDNPDPANGSYPNDTHRVLPPGLEHYVNIALFTAETPLGGYYNWEGPDNYPYAGVAIENPEAGDETLAQVDDVIDDGDLASGTFRKTPNGRYTLILWEP